VQQREIRRAIFLAADQLEQLRFYKAAASSAPTAPFARELSRSRFSPEIALLRDDAL